LDTAIGTLYANGQFTADQLSESIDTIGATFGVVKSLDALASSDLEQATGDLLYKLTSYITIASRSLTTSWPTVQSGLSAFAPTVLKIMDGIMNTGGSSEKTYGTGTACYATMFKKVSYNALLVAGDDITMTMTQCDLVSTFKLPLAAITTANTGSADNLIIRVSVSAAFRKLSGDNTDLGNVIPISATTKTAQYSLAIYNPATNAELQATLVGTQRFSVRYLVADARECTGAAFESGVYSIGAQTYGTDAITSDTLTAECVRPVGLDDTSSSAISGTVEILGKKIGSSTLYTAIRAKKFDNLPTISAADLLTDKRSNYRECMVAANYGSTAVAACEATLVSTFTQTITGYATQNTEQKATTLVSQKGTAAAEELADRDAACTAGAWACAASTTSTGCLICRSTAELYYQKVANIAVCTATDCASTDVTVALAVDQLAYTAVKDAANTCMNAATTDAARDLCVTNDMQNALNSALGRTASTIELYTYIQTSAVTAMKEEMSSCTSALTGAALTTAALSNCLQATAKNQLANSLGITAAAVTTEQLYTFATQAAEIKLTATVQDCMEAAGVLTTTAAQAARATCVTGAETKQSLANSLGLMVADLTDTDLQKYITSAATDKAALFIDTCVDTISTSLSAAAQAAAGTSCRQVSGCADLANNLGLLSTELTTSNCLGYLNAATNAAVQDAMSGCIAAVDTTATVAAQTAARGLCKTVTTNAALNKQNGVPNTATRRASSSSESLQYAVDNAAVVAVSAAVTNCMQGVTSSQTDAVKEATRTACRTTSAKTSIANSLGVLESTISANTVTEFVTPGAVLAVSNTIAACTASQTGTALTTCMLLHNPQAQLRREWQQSVTWSSKLINTERAYRRLSRRQLHVTKQAHLQLATIWQHTQPTPVTRLSSLTPTRTLQRCQLHMLLASSY